MQTETINIGRTSFVIPGGMQRLKVMPEDPPLMQTFGFHTDGAMFPNHPLSVCRSFVRTIRDGN